MITIPVSEQETTINIDRDSPTARIYTCDSTMMTKLDKRCKSNPKEYKMLKEVDGGKWYSCPKKLIRFGTPKVMTEEQKQAARERMLKTTRKT